MIISDREIGQLLFRNTTHKCAETRNFGPLFGTSAAIVYKKRSGKGRIFIFYKSQFINIALNYISLHIPMRNLGTVRGN